MRGQALRYLAELPFVPLAMVSNDELTWAGIDEGRAEVATSVAGERLAVTLEARSEGDIVHSSSEDRLFRAGSNWVSRPWGGHFGDYQTLGGIRIPTSGDAYWELPEGRYVYWRGTVKSAAFLDRPFRRGES